MNKYPVISLSLKECKCDTFKEFKEEFKEIIAKLYNKYKYILDSEKLMQIDKDYFLRCLKKEEDLRISSALATLVSMLKEYYNEQVIVLLDEYDAPIMEGYLKNYYEDIINFIRKIFSSTFKNNLNLKKGIITGILRVSKEGMFSGANNVKVYNITDYKYSTYFGFSEDEIKEVLEEYQISNKFNDVKTWYDGYIFGTTTIYNPWSIINFLADPKNILRVYWANTGGVDLLKKLIYSTDGNVSVLDEYHSLLETGYIKHINLDYDMNLMDLNRNHHTIWTLFMLAGYLSPVEGLYLEDVSLKIPNLEIRKNLENICINWFNQNVSYTDDLIKSLITNDMYNFKNILTDIVNTSFSYYDLPTNNIGESFYHAFVMGLLYVNIKEFEITSNRESGYGRFDLMLKPKSDNCRYAYIIEFKAISNGDFEKTMEDAFKQIEDKQYAASLKEYDTTKIVIVFKCKELKIEIRK